MILSSSLPPSLPPRAFYQHLQFASSFDVMTVINWQNVSYTMSWYGRFTIPKQPASIWHQMLHFPNSPWESQRCHRKETASVAFEAISRTSTRSADVTGSWGCAAPRADLRLHRLETGEAPKSDHIPITYWTAALLKDMAAVCGICYWLAWSLFTCGCREISLCVNEMFIDNLLLYFVS